MNYPQKMPLRKFVVSASYLLINLLFCSGIYARQSVARQWNEVLLEAIRNDFARPTVHARNLFHVSAAMYDAWAVYDMEAEPYLLGQKVGSFECVFDGIPVTEDITASREEAISYAAYRLLRHRFVFSPGGEGSLARFDSLMLVLGYDKDFTSTDYSGGSAAALGNYIAKCYQSFGLQDNSNERKDYANEYYLPVNPYLSPEKPGSQGMEDPNRWQPLSFNFFIDQAGFEIPGGIPDFLSPEWGQVTPFALSAEHLTIHERVGSEYWVYHDPGPPAYLEKDGGGSSDDYKWNHSLVAVWSALLDPSDGVMIDISPNALGNLDIDSFPRTVSGLRSFYNRDLGGDKSKGYELNPHTGKPYQPQIVSRADYARVLAEFWADGPDSETPPGHWFTILNYVSDHPLLLKKFKGEGPLLDNLEWDIKAYFILGGTMHDAAVAAWSVKGWYDYVRPISAIRYMADRGQSSDPELPNYSPEGILLIPGYIELVEAGDSLAGDQNEHVGKVKLYAWRGPNYIPDPATTVGGVDWILAENWWPYQRPTFVTPPFGGYVSGHSTFSRAAAEVLTLLTGDPYFPGGIGEFEARKNEFLVFEEGPSSDVILQWAKYYDASDQCSLSRIWGGIHPPVDDIRGRLIGEKIGKEAFRFAAAYFGKQLTSTVQVVAKSLPFRVHPNPSTIGQQLLINLDNRAKGMIQWELITAGGIVQKSGKVSSNLSSMTISLSGIPPGLYWLRLQAGDDWGIEKVIIQ